MLLPTNPFKIYSNYRCKKPQKTRKPYLLGLTLLMPSFFSSIIYPSVDTKNWMQRLGKTSPNLRINEIFIPGSHDSAANKLEDKIGVNQDIPQKLEKILPIIRLIVKKWAQAQGASIKQQLENGIRYVDLRVQWRDKKKDFYLLHSLYGPPLQQVLNEIMSFLTDHPQEILIIQIGDLKHMPNNSHNKLCTLLQQTFSNKLVPSEKYNLPTIGEIQKSQRQVILIYNDSGIAKEYGFFTRSRINSPWANCSKSKNLKNKLNSYIRDRKPNNYNFFVIQGQLSPDKDSILSGLNPFSKAPRSLKDFSKKINPLLPNWINEWNKKYPGKINIIIADFVDKELATKIISLNQQLIKK